MLNNQRHFSFSDHFWVGVDQMLRAVCNNPKKTDRPYPGNDTKESVMTVEQRRLSARLMRVNHAGEICAQALYHGQAIASHCSAIKEKMQQAAIEEGDHLAWCYFRLLELNSHTSYLNFLWYLGSFTLGLTAGLVGNAWSLGFLAETENQVVQHLDNHLALLPIQDKKSYKILQEMQNDEAKHRDDAIKTGAARLPSPIKKLMAIVSKIMVKTAYWV